MNSDLSSSLEVLGKIPDADLSTLRDIYKDVSPQTDHIYNYLSSVIKWNTLHPTSEYFTVLVPENWRKTGTFIGINKYFCTELFIATLEEDCRTLCEAIINTKQIDWSGPWLIYAMYDKLFPYVSRALESTSFDMGMSGCGNIWRAPKEKATQFVVNCPNEVYISELKPEHAKIINPHWPPRYTGSQNYLEVLIIMNGGYGVFLKSNDKLVAWVIHNLIGLGAIQTLPEYLKKGYGSLITTYLAKKIAEAGYNPLGTVHQGNIPSERMFTKIGFEMVGSTYFIDDKLMENLEKAAK